MLDLYFYMVFLHLYCSILALWIYVSLSWKGERYLSMLSKMFRVFLNPSNHRCSLFSTSKRSLNNVINTTGRFRFCRSKVSPMLWSRHRETRSTRILSFLKQTCRLDNLLQAHKHAADCWVCRYTSIQQTPFSFQMLICERNTSHNFKQIVGKFIWNLSFWFELCV